MYLFTLWTDVVVSHSPGGDTMILCWSYYLLLTML